MPECKKILGIEGNARQKYEKGTCMKKEYVDKIQEQK